MKPTPQLMKTARVLAATLPQLIDGKRCYLPVLYVDSVLTTIDKVAAVADENAAMRMARIHAQALRVSQIKKRKGKK